MATRAAGRSEQVWITMDDGVRLAASLYLPDADTPQPCLLEALPYRKDDITSSYGEEYERLRDEFSYAVCRVDLRGTGSSEGIAVDEYPRREQDDLVVGTPIANRTHAGLEGLIGFFVNTLALRSRVEGDPTFRELLASSRSTALGAYAHQDLPFEKLVEELRVERSLHHAPVFQVLLVLQNAPMPDLELPGLTLSPVPLAPGTAKFDLSLSFQENGRATLEYDARLFDDATAEQMPLVQTLWGQVKFARGSYEQAFGHFDKALAADPRVPDLHVYLGMIHVRRERYEMAEQAFRKALELDEDHAAAHDGLGVALYMQKRFEDAVYQHMRSAALVCRARWDPMRSANRR
jgi:non-ribosomal peptide synthetase component F